MSASKTNVSDPIVRGNLVSSSKASAMIGMSPKYLFNLVKAGRCPIPAYIILGNYRFDTEDIKDLIKSSRIGAGE